MEVDKSFIVDETLDEFQSRHTPENIAHRNKYNDQAEIAHRNSYNDQAEIAFHIQWATAVLCESHNAITIII